MNSHSNTFRYLTSRQTEQPQLAMEEFFDAFELPACYTHLWQLAKSWVSSEYADGLTARQRAEMLFFYEQLGTLIEAAFATLHASDPASVVALTATPAA
jgi:hypothetical protein